MISICLAVNIFRVRGYALWIKLAMGTDDENFVSALNVKLASVF